jgi:hypothetical protein
VVTFISIFHDEEFLTAFHGGPHQSLWFHDSHRKKFSNNVKLATHTPYNISNRTVSLVSVLSSKATEKYTTSEAYYLAVLANRCSSYLPCNIQLFFWRNLYFQMFFCSRGKLFHLHPAVSHIHGVKTGRLLCLAVLYATKEAYPSHCFTQLVLGCKNTLLFVVI